MGISSARRAILAFKVLVGFFLGPDFIDGIQQFTGVGGMLDQKHAFPHQGIQDGFGHKLNVQVRVAVGQRAGYQRGQRSDSRNPGSGMDVV